MLMRLGMILALLCVAACQTLPKIEVLPPLSHTITVQVSEAHGDLWQHSLLMIVPQSDQQWRFIQVDALGAPLARQTLQQGQWANNGFLPPNRQASVLFSAVYAYLAKEKDWPLPDGLQQVTIVPLPNGEAVEIHWQQQSWRVKELADE